jgi:AcrR family transcriptional regulator
MSSLRVRPTRDETRRRLFAAAAQVFATHGVGGATVEQIAAAASFTRGAFYSNFATKEELLLAMLEDHVERSVAYHRAALAERADAEAYLAAVRSNRGREDDPLHRSPLLQIELILHVARTPSQRPALARRLRTMRTLIGEIVVRTLRDAGVEHAIDPAQAGTVLLAIEDGLRLHRLIDPASTPERAELDAFRWLKQLVAPAAPATTRPRRAPRSPRRPSGSRR